MATKLGSMDKLFLQLETATTPMHVGGLLLFRPPPDASPSFVLDHFSRYSDSRVCAQPFNWLLQPGRKPSWREVSSVDMNAHIHRRMLSSSGSDEFLMETISGLHSTPIDQSRPMWECYPIDGLNGGRFGVYYKIHHACIDGVSAIKRMQNALSTSPDIDTPPLWAEKRTEARAKKRERPALPKRLAKAVAALRGQAGGVAEITATLASMLRSARRDRSKLTSLPYSSPQTALNGMVSARRNFAFQRLPLSGVREIGKAAGATVNDVALAICSAALRDLLIRTNQLPDRPLIAMVPVSLRELSDGAAGNAVTSILCNLGTHIADPLERLATIVESTRHGKQLIRKMSKDAAVAYSLFVMFPAIAMQLMGAAKIAPLPFNVVVSNVPGPRAQLYERGASLEAIYPVSLLFERQAVNFTLISYLDTLDFGLLACAEAIPDLQRVARDITAAYDQLRVATKTA
jgi:WS/DGAT/MGAT family acyltransferase